MIPFSLLWGGFAIFWEVGVISSGAPFFFCLFGVPFVLVGLYIMIGRFFFDAQQRARTFYGVSYKRIIIVSGVFSRTIKSLSLKTLSDITLTEKSDRSGVIAFGPTNPFVWMYGGIAWPGMGQHQSPCFDGILDAKGVYETIRRAQETNSNG